MAITCSHGGNIGDIVFALPSLKALAERRGDTISLYVTLNAPASYYPGATHPLKHVRINEDYFTKLQPLLLAQRYLGQVERHQGEQVEFDLDQFRRTPPDPTKNHIARWYFPVLKVCCDLSEPWLTIGGGTVPADLRVVISRTSRYQNPRLNYKFLERYKCVFVGLPEEHADFQKRFFELPHVEAADFAQLAALIAAARLFIGNQSFAWTLAEGVKVPRILEACHFSNNVIPHGKQAYDVYCQRDFEAFTEEELKHEEDLSTRPGGGDGVQLLQSKSATAALLP